MKLQSLSILLSTFISVNLLLSYSQDKWIWQNPIPQGNNLWCIKSYNDSLIVATGENATIVITTDGGNNFDVQNNVAGQVNTLLDICFIDRYTWTAVGHNGLIVRTTDGGTTWVKQASGTVAFLRGVYFSSKDTGIIVGYFDYGIVLKTTDGGSNWSSESYEMGLLGLAFFNSSEGVVIGKDGIIRTSNGGATWTKIKTGVWIEEIVFLDDSNGIVTGRDGMYCTKDGGRSWVHLSSPFYPIVAGYIDSNVVVATAGTGSIMRSSNGGLSWDLQYSGTTEGLYGLCFSNSSKGFAVGINGVLLETRDKGVTWTILSSTVSYADLHAVSFTDYLTGTAVGSTGTILHTTDSGKTWTPQQSGTRAMLLGVSFADPHYGFVVGDSGIILHTTDDGSSWMRQNSHISWVLRAVSFKNPKIGTVVGDYRTILRTTDSGNTWTIQDVQPSGVFFGVSFINTLTGSVVGGSGAILHTTDGGINWFTQTSPSSENLYAISLVDHNHGTVVGSSGVILRTIDGGITWQKRQSETSAFFSGVSFVDSVRGIAVGGDIAQTSDGGEHWIVERTKTDLLYGVSFPDTNASTIVGTHGAILHKGIMSATSQFPIVDLNISRQFKLDQNYPNPFNSSTNITFTIPSKSFVSMKVFDLLGREVKTLISEELSAGSYSRRWITTNESSGIYFYRLQADQFSQTKKILLLK
jgi:photosystem II stability/assembly factor-like uncharacterized protein